MATETIKAPHIKAVGDAYVITAGFKFDTVVNLIKYGKDAALTLVDLETKDPYFAVSVGKTAEASKYGVVFTGADKNGFAQCTGSFPKLNMSEAEKAAYLKDNYAYTLANLTGISAQIVDAEKTLESLMKAVDASITIE